MNPSDLIPETEKNHVDIRVLELTLRKLSLSSSKGEARDKAASSNEEDDFFGFEEDTGLLREKANIYDSIYPYS